MQALLQRMPLVLSLCAGRTMCRPSYPLHGVGDLWLELGEGRLQVVVVVVIRTHGCCETGGGGSGVLQWPAAAGRASMLSKSPMRLQESVRRYSKFDSRAAGGRRGGGGGCEGGEW